MTRDDVIRMAREADEGHAGMECEQFGGGIVSVSTLERFAALVAAAEREECAKVCGDRAMRCELEANQAMESGERDESSALRSTAWQISVCADAIRARGNQ